LDVYTLESVVLALLTIFARLKSSRLKKCKLPAILINPNKPPPKPTKARATDNIVIERLWRTIKYEDIYPSSYSTIKEARVGTGKYVGVLKLNGKFTLLELN